MHQAFQALTLQGEDEGDGVQFRLQTPVEGELDGEGLSAAHHQSRILHSLHQVEFGGVVRRAILGQQQVAAEHLQRRLLCHL